MIHLNEREHLLHLKFIATFFAGNTTLLRTNHPKQRVKPFCIFYPSLYRGKMSSYHSYAQQSQEEQMDCITFLKGERG